MGNMRYNRHKKYSLFIGRWQPFHNGHKFLIDEALAKGKNVCIAIRDTELSSENPYTAQQRTEMIRRVYADKVHVIVIPDIESINIGRNVGYEINRFEPPEEIKSVSATKVRQGKETRVPKEVAEYLKLLKTTVWFTGLPCSGKTTLAKRLKEELDNRGYKTVHLDGDDVRNGLNKDLGFTGADRNENLRRVAHVAQLFNDAGNIVIASFITPTNEQRDLISDIISNFQLIYLKCSVDECEKRDIKGMYKKARKGKIKDFTGISAPFEKPDTNIVVDTGKNDVESCIRQILDHLL